jgi:parallel beta-helix repeat protein
VDASGSGDYKTIAAAYANAKPGEIIVLRPGTYKESLTVRNDVRIVGEGGRSKVIVESAPDASVFWFTAGSATLTGMTIRGVGTGTGTGAIDVTGGTPVIEDCDLTSSARTAVYILGAGANPVIRNCTIRDSGVCGVDVFNQGQGTIEKCVISGNARAGVQISKGGNPVVRDCEIRGNGYEGVWVLDQGQGTFTGNTLTGNAGGAWAIASDAGRVTRTGNTPNA